MTQTEGTFEDYLEHFFVHKETVSFLQNLCHNLTAHKNRQYVMRL